MEYDPVTNEPIVFEVQFDPGRSWPDLKKRWASTDWRDFRANVGPLRPFWALRPGVPLRSLALTLPLALVWALATPRLKDYELEIPLFVAWLAVFGICLDLRGRQRPVPGYAPQR